MSPTPTKTSRGSCSLFKGLRARREHKVTKEQPEPLAPQGLPVTQEPVVLQVLLDQEAAQDLLDLQERVGSPGLLDPLDPPVLRELRASLELLAMSVRLALQEPPATLDLRVQLDSPELQALLDQLAVQEELDQPAPLDPRVHKA